MPLHCFTHPSYTEGCINCDYHILFATALRTNYGQIVEIQHIMKKNIKGTFCQIDEEELDRHNGRVSILDILEKILNTRGGVVIVNGSPWFTDDFILIFTRCLDILGGFTANTTKYTMAVNKSTVPYYSVSKKVEFFEKATEALEKFRNEFPLGGCPENKLCNVLFSYDKMN